MNTLIFFFICLINATLWAKPLDHLLKEMVMMDFQDGTRLEISKLFVREYVPDDATVVSLAPHPALGWVQFQVIWEKDGERKSVWGSAHVKAFQKMVVTRKIIKRFESFNSQNAELQEREISPYRLTGYYDNLDKLLGFRARTNISLGSVVGSVQTEEELAIHKGQTVELVNQKGDLKITASMVAVEDGRLNQWIRVENPSSHKILRARVVSEGLTSLH